jgi:hypothetical protein
VKQNVVRSFGLMVAVTSLFSLSAPASSGTVSSGAASTGAAGSAATSSGTTVLSPCGDRAYTLYGTRWTSALRWSFDASSTPGYLSRRAAELRLIRAARAVANGRNRCGLASYVSAPAQYLGRTTARPNVLPNGWCGRQDGRNEVGFGTLPASELALTCYWSKNGSTIESDILFNKAVYRFTARVTSGCRMAWSLRAVATHEFGHAFGLGHVRDPLNEHLTMAPYILPCQSSEARLGLGDLDGMRALYRASS